jgi:hypothetical protein
MKCSKYRGVSQKRWCVLTAKRIYFFESFWASKYSAPTEAIPWSRVLSARYACSSAEKRTLTVCCKSRLLGLREVCVDLFGGGDDMDSTWCECFAKLQGVKFIADLEDRKPQTCASAVDAVDVSRRPPTINSSGSGLRRIPKMAQIATQLCEQAALSEESSEISSEEETDCTDSISSSSIPSDTFIEDPDRGRSPFSFRYGKEMCCADMCANYMSAKLSRAKASPSVSTMDSDGGDSPALGASCDDASSYASSEIGDNFSDVVVVGQ